MDSDERISILIIAIAGAIGSLIVIYWVFKYCKARFCKGRSQSEPNSVDILNNLDVETLSSIIVSQESQSQRTRQPAQRNINVPPISTISTLESEHNAAWRIQKNQTPATEDDYDYIEYARKIRELEEQRKRRSRRYNNSFGWIRERPNSSDSGDEQPTFSTYNRYANDTVVSVENSLPINVVRNAKRNRHRIKRSPELSSASFVDNARKKDFYVIPIPSPPTPTPTPPSYDDERKKIHDLKRQKVYEEVAQLQNEILTSRGGTCTSESLECELIIGVDARPTQIGGYLIDLRNFLCDSYTYKSEKLPWVLNDNSMLGDPEEFEMKNLLFALFLWEDVIENSSLRIYTDNFAVKQKSSKYGCRVQEFLKHLKKCKEAKIIDPELHVNRVRKPEAFALYIQPADDLSRWRLKECENFLTKAYNLKHYSSTHSSKKVVGGKHKYKGPQYPKTALYNVNLNKVKEATNKYTQSSCQKCGFYLPDTGSLRSISIS